MNKMNHVCGISLHSRRKLKPNDAQRFTQLEAGLFRDLALVVCSIGVVPQKELHESWQMASAVHSIFPDSLQVADLAAGHGLLSWILVLLARFSETPRLRTAVAIDIKKPKSANILAEAMASQWPELAGTVHYIEGSIDSVWCENGSNTLFVAAHACGNLSDRALLTAIKCRSSVAIMPCCHSLRHQGRTLESLALASDLATYSSEKVINIAAKIGQSKAIDQIRIDALNSLGYGVVESEINVKITKFNRIIMGKAPAARENSGPEISPVITPTGYTKRIGGMRAYEKIQSINLSDASAMQTLSLRPSFESLRFFDLSFWVSDDETGFQLAQDLVFLMDRILSATRIDNGKIIPETEVPAHLDSQAAFNAFSNIETLLPSLGKKVDSKSVTIHDQYTDPRSNKVAFTYRVAFGSRAAEITKIEAIELRRKICRAIGFLGTIQSKKSEWRGSLF